MTPTAIRGQEPRLAWDLTFMSILYWVKVGAGWAGLPSRARVCALPPRPSVRQRTQEPPAGYGGLSNAT